MVSRVLGRRGIQSRVDRGTVDRGLEARRVNQEFNVGDVVSYYTNVPSIKKAFKHLACSGIILSPGVSLGSKRSLYKIMWNDGKVSSEWGSYLKHYEGVAFGQKT